MKNIAIKIWGLGSHLGVEKVTKAQYDFWSGRNDLAEALDPNVDYDFESIGVPEKSKLPWDAFWDYMETMSLSGVSVDGDIKCQIQVIENDTNEVLSRNLIELLDDLQSADDSGDYVEEIDEFYSAYDLGSGHFVSWRRIGVGLWFNGNLQLDDTENFDETYLSVKTVDCEGSEFLVSVFYKGEQVHNDGYHVDWQDPEIHLVKIENKCKTIKDWCHNLLS